MKTFVKYLGASALFSFVLITIFVLFFYEGEERVEYQLAGLMACVKKDNCQMRTTEESFSGLDFLGVYLKMPENNINIKYMVGNGFVIVVVVVDQDNQVTLTDIGFDGEVDSIGLIKKGEFSQPKNADFAFWQNIYNKSLHAAWERVIPDHIKEELKKMPTQDAGPAKSSPARIKA